jgi:hypothetical protein
MGHDACAEHAGPGQVSREVFLFPRPPRGHMIRGSPLNKAYATRVENNTLMITELTDTLAEQCAHVDSSHKELFRDVLFSFTEIVPNMLQFDQGSQFCPQYGVSQSSKKAASCATTLPCKFCRRTSARTAMLQHARHGLHHHVALHVI